jgi:hypothetical protein
MMGAVDADRSLGMQVAGYAIESVLGRGAMGVLYVARQQSADRRVALKRIHPAFADDEEFRERFLREARAAAAIDHPHILPVYDAGESNGVLFIAMRLVEGEDLRAILRASGRLAPDRVLVIAGQIGAALDAAHARGLIHRDVKPGNILVAQQTDADETDFCYLTDFGISTWTTSSAPTLTTTGRMVGSLNYAAPEQIEGKRVGAAADLYSLGCVLFECLTGSPPFAGRSAPGVLYAHVHEEPPPVSSFRPELPPAVDAVVGRALRKRPDERYSSCRDLTLDLRAALAGGTTGSRTAPTRTIPAPSSSRRRRRRVWVAAAAVVAGLAIGLTTLAILGVFRRAPAPSGPRPSLIRSGVQVTASLTAPASKDAAGNVVTFLPRNVVDGNVETAWRAPGDGRGVTLRLLFDNPIEVVRVGLIPGYAKFDPQSGTNRFEEERIIKQVRYLIPGLPSVTQTFRPIPIPQYVPIHATTSRMTIEILDTTEPGGRDFTPISEIYVYGYPQ